MFPLKKLSKSSSYYIKCKIMWYNSVNCNSTTTRVFSNCLSIINFSVTTNNVPVRFFISRTLCLNNSRYDDSFYDCPIRIGLGNIKFQKFNHKSCIEYFRGGMINNLNVNKKK